MSSAVKPSLKPTRNSANILRPDFVQSLGVSGGAPLIVTVPHSGERLPPEATWLVGLDERLLMYDVDRFVDELYSDSLTAHGIAWVKTEWHRYACDLNRLETDVDQASVVGAPEPVGRHPRGLHWSKTTMGDVLMAEPVSYEVHRLIVERCFRPFHEAVNEMAEAVLPKSERSEARPLFHLDLHSMPSLGTKEHRDPGEFRADLVISNQDGASSSSDFFKLVCEAGRGQGFEVRENWPYKGGRITETYGRPRDGWQTVQIELNRKLYMNETTKQKIEPSFGETKLRVGRMLAEIHNRVSQTETGR